MLQNGAPQQETIAKLQRGGRTQRSRKRASRSSRSRPPPATRRSTPRCARYIEFLTADGQLEVDLEIDPDVRLAPDEQIEVFRIVQEGLANVRKHANATRAEVVIGMRDYERFVSVRDDGEGFDGESTAAGQGLKNIRARTKTHRGRLHADVETGTRHSARSRSPHLAHTLQRVHDPVSSVRRSGGRLAQRLADGTRSSVRVRRRRVARGGRAAGHLFRRHHAPAGSDRRSGSGCTGEHLRSVADARASSLRGFESGGASRGLYAHGRAVPPTEDPDGARAPASVDRRRGRRAGSGQRPRLRERGGRRSSPARCIRRRSSTTRAWCSGLRGSTASRSARR